MAEELDLHLLELARAEGEVPRRDLVAKALADLGDAERDAARACCRSTFLKLTKMPWAVSGRRKAAPSSPPSAPTIVLNIRLNSRGSVSVPSSLASGPSTCAKSLTVVSETSVAFPVPARRRSWPRRLKNFSASLLGFGQSFVAAGLRGDEDPSGPWPRPSGRAPGRGDSASSTRGNRP